MSERERRDTPEQGDRSYHLEEIDRIEREIDRIEDLRRTHITERLEENFERQKQLLQEGRDFQRKSWTDPGPHHDHEAKSINREISELTQEAHNLIEKLEALTEARTQRADALDQMLKANTQKLRSAWERQYELDKHITTLSTAAILGVAALTRLFPTSPALEPAASISLICFLVAIVLAIFAMLGDNLEILAVDAFREVAPRGKVLKFAKTVVEVVMWVFRVVSLTAFCVGLIVIILLAIETTT